MTKARMVGALFRFGVSVSRRTLCAGVPFLYLGGICCFGFCVGGRALWDSLSILFGVAGWPLLASVGGPERRLLRKCVPGFPAVPLQICWWSDLLPRVSLRPQASPPPTLWYGIQRVSPVDPSRESSTCQNFPSACKSSPAKCTRRPGAPSPSPGSVPRRCRFQGPLCYRSRSRCGFLLFLFRCRFRATRARFGFRLLRCYHRGLFLFLCRHRVLVGQAAV